jgi:hypothetical protein
MATARTAFLNLITISFENIKQRTSEAILGGAGQGRLKAR